MLDLENGEELAIGYDQGIAHFLRRVKIWLKKMFLKLRIHEDLDQIVQEENLESFNELEILDCLIKHKGNFAKFELFKKSILPRLNKLKQSNFKGIGLKLFITILEEEVSRK